MLKQRSKLLVAAGLVLGSVWGCSSMSAEDSAKGSSGPHGVDGNGNSAGPGGSLPDGMQEPQPEQEVNRAFQVPVVSGRWVWTANPSSGRVALIDAKSFVVTTALAGAGPTYLAALPTGKGESARAVVINSVSEDATVLSADEDGAIAATLTLPVHQGANAWSVTPDGHFAIAWTDALATPNADPSEGFQDITVLDLEADEPSSKRLSVGYRPARIFMDDDSRYAYVVTDAGLDVVDLLADGGAAVEREVELSDDPANDTARREVNMTPDGKLAFVSREGKAYVTVVNVELGERREVSLPGAVTDLDLSADASMAVAIIRQPTLVADPSAAGAGAGGQSGAGGNEGGSEAGDVEEGGGRGLDGVGGADSGMAGGGGGAGQGLPDPDPAGEHSLAVLLPVASIFESPDLFDSVAIREQFGSVELGQQGATALLFSNGVPSSHLTLLDLAAGDTFKQHRTVDVQLPIFSAFETPDGAHAVALLKPPAGSAKPGAFAVVPVAEDLPPRIQGTQAVTVPEDLAKLAPAMVALDDERAVVTVSDPATQTFVAYVVKLPELTIDAIPLASAPLRQASGIVAEANQAFVAQQHPEGRITFIDLDTMEPRTLTGFELSTEVGK